MRITARVEYAVLALFELALNSRERQVQAREISERQKIPLRFLEQIMIQLKKAQLVKSLRGAAGGYLLGRPPGEITLKDVVEAVEGEISLLDPRLGPDSIVSVVWREIEREFLEELASVTMEDLVDRKLKHDNVVFYQI